MVLMMVNNQIKESMQRKQNRTPPRAEDEYMDSQAEAEELNQLIKKMSVKLPRSENDEYESYISSNDSTTKTINNKYTFLISRAWKSIVEFGNSGKSGGWGFKVMFMEIIKVDFQKIYIF